MYTKGTIKLFSINKKTILFFTKDRFKNILKIVSQVISISVFIFSFPIYF